MDNPTHTRRNFDEDAVVTDTGGSAIDHPLFPAISRSPSAVVDAPSTGVVTPPPSRRPRCSTPLLLTAETAETPPSRRHRGHSLGVTGLAILIFYGASGGPFGIEMSVRAGGPALALAGFVLMPLVWSVPEALVTSELSAAFPESSGCVAWVEEAFGPRWGLVQGYLSWSSGVVDNAIYPGMFLMYLLPADGDDDDDAKPLRRAVSLVAINAALVYLNYRGLGAVEKFASAAAAFVMVPFVIMCAAGLHRVEVGRLLVPATRMACQETNTCPSDAGSYVADVDWAGLLNNLFWNLSAFDTASSFAGDVADPGRTWPRAMCLAVTFTSLQYLLPLVVAVGAVPSSRSDWVVGYLTAAAAAIGGQWLARWTVAAAAVSSLALYEAEMSADSLGLAGMAERGLVPEIFAVRGKYGAPTVPLAVGSAIALAGGFLPLEEIVELTNLLYCVSLVIELAAFIRLRVSQPNLDRPYRIPLSTFWCVIMLVPANILLIVMMALASWKSYAVCGGAMVGGLALYHLQHLGRRRGWWKFRVDDKYHQIETVVVDNKEGVPIL